MNKKKISIILAIILVFTLIVWPRKVVLKIGVFAGSNWDVPSGDSYTVIDDAIQRFEKQYPQVQVEYESGVLKEDYSLWLSQEYLKGEEPDVFMILSEDFNTLSSLGALKNLDSLMKKDSEFQKDKFYSSSYHAGNYQNKQYALPYESDPTLMFVNKTLLKKEGIEVPDDQWTLEDFYQICQRMTKDTNGDGSIDQYGCYEYDWLDSIYAHDVTLFDEEGTHSYFSQESVKNAIQFIQRLESLNQGHIITSNDFDNGKVAFAPMPFSQYRTYKPYPWRVKKYSNFEWDCIKMPSLSHSKSRSEVSSLLMGISSRTHHTKEAWNFLKTLTYNEETQQNLFEYSQGVSSLKAVTSKNQQSIEDGEIDLSLLNNVMENTNSRPQFKKYDAALSLANTHIQQMIQKQTDIDLSLIELQKTIEKYLQE